MMYADTDFFLAMLKSRDWLKASAIKAYGTYKGSIHTSETTFVELMLLSHKYGLDPVQVVADVMAITKTSDTTYLKAAYFIKENKVSVFDAFHAAHAGKEIISSDSVYDSWA
ncbi:MAG: PIN domain-containing protein [Candidatus Micrarchaeota archaeon]|nr:PIN domain-containing protein [Candidatus Micrarchaeota archaeon]MDE1847578.1 PIN domain-containing protein [Candidatus Micrarchaeota archaeon]MDE1864295.1 PIN domain-containing protein [Candidatus Micrarchaeota archaeon]